MANCSNLLIHCMDFRIQDAINDYIAKAGIKGDVDRIAIPGPVRDTALTLSYVETSKKLHDIERVYLCQHVDCGAYGGRRAFSSDGQEREALQRDLDTVVAAIGEKFPELKIRQLLVIQAPGWKVVEL